MVWYLLIINIIAFMLYGLDKNNAIKKRYRISEYSLFVIAMFGGALGSLIGMKVFHHKTKKTIFWILNSLFLVIWIIYLI